MLQQLMTAFSGPGLDESRGLQSADYLGPRHYQIVNLTLGYVKARNYLAFHLLPRERSEEAETRGGSAPETTAERARATWPPPALCASARRRS